MQICIGLTENCGITLMLPFAGEQLKPILGLFDAPNGPEVTLFPRKKRFNPATFRYAAAAAIGLINLIDNLAR